MQEAVVLSDSFGHILIVGTHESVTKPLADLLHTPSLGTLTLVRFAGLYIFFEVEVLLFFVHISYSVI